MQYLQKLLERLEQNLNPSKSLRKLLGVLSCKDKNSKFKTKFGAGFYM